MDNLILGAGMAGFGASCALDHRARIFEGSSAHGGLCGTFKVSADRGDFLFDTAVHLSFADQPVVRKIFDRVPQYRHNPQPWNFHNGIWIRHPVINNLYALPVNERVKCIRSFLERPRDMISSNYKEWNIEKYGYYIYENFAHKYGTKYWCCDLAELGTDWIGNRLYQPTTEEVLFGAMTDDTPNCYYAPEMRYPLKGGFVSFLNECHKHASVKYNKKAVRISPSSKTVFFSDGTSDRYEKLFSSVPLIELADITDNVPEEILSLSSGLNHTSMALVSFGFSRPVCMDKFWFYIYDTDIMASRVYAPHMKSPANVPEGCSSLQFEIPYNSRYGTPPEADAAVENCIYALKKMKLASEDDIIFSDHRTAKYANIIISGDTRERAGKVKKYFDSTGIFPVGRFGEWDYLWSHQAFESGYNTALNNR